MSSTVRGAVAALILALAVPASAQTIGTFRWQLQPYCNVITVAVTQVGTVYTLAGADDQCAAGPQAPANGTAVLNADSSVGIGLNIVATPGGAPVHVAASVSLATFSGSWQDSLGGSGTFAFSPAGGNGGNPRPAAGPAIPPAIQLRADGGVVAGGSFDSGSPIPANGPGTRMMWHPDEAAFRVGQVTADQWDSASIGRHSFAAGLDTVASGENSVAFGRSTVASGSRAVAFGFQSRATAAHAFANGLFAQATAFGAVAFGDSTLASNTDAVAMGFDTTASGNTSFAAGNQTVASGTSSFAMGTGSTAAGTGAVAMGRDVHAFGSSQSVVLGSFARSLVNGVFLFGDSSTSNVVFAPAANSFTVRAAGGYNLFSSSSLTSGVTLAPGGGSWASVSDVNMKQHFRDLDGDDVLTKIARMRIQEWSYKTQDASIRHVGPTAQDFRAAFGLGEDPLKISTIDADGVALAAIKALEARTRALQEENEALRRRIEQLERR